MEAPENIEEIQSFAKQLAVLFDAKVLHLTQSSRFYIWFPRPSIHAPSVDFEVYGQSEETCIVLRGLNRQQTVRVASLIAQLAKEASDERTGRIV